MTRRLKSLALLLVVLLAPLVLTACEEDEVKIHREEHRAPRTVRQEEVVVP